MKEIEVKDKNRTTCVFDFDILSFDGNPHCAETPFGRPVIISMGDLSAENDLLLAENDQRKWQPIETSPRDGTRILVFSSSAEECGITIGSWTPDVPEPVLLDDIGDSLFNAVHWMTLPVFPAAETRQKPEDEIKRRVNKWNKPNDW